MMTPTALRTLNTVLFFTFMALQLLDVLYTRQVIMKGIGHEGNPVLALLMNPTQLPALRRILDRLQSFTLWRLLPLAWIARWWPWIVLSIVKVALIAFMAAAWVTLVKEPATAELLTGLDLFYLWVVYHNYRLLWVDIEPM